MAQLMKARSSARWRAFFSVTPEMIGREVGTGKCRTVAIRSIRVYDSLRMIDAFIIPTKRPTRAEIAALVVFSSVVSLVLGIVALVVAFRAAPEKHDLALALAHYGWRSLIFGVVIAIAFWLFHRFKNS